MTRCRNSGRFIYYVREDLNNKIPEDLVIIYFIRNFYLSYFFYNSDANLTQTQISTLKTNFKSNTNSKLKRTFRSEMFLLVFFSKIFDRFEDQVHLI